ncbi:hypothetical protein J8273_2497 [Carpediemonas membranifera]|uniref:Uncharacterized protein n=1 Tax=Carpediemonas membranifera TaxID=201153 RepID=A0A8J6EB36_9EUKA|nr:hypothetical protein J8273_2497 [Carpediemonas membranifera]|eukprot:KAG9396145.1 hypothetical protein J8273_2497 [Carpediemonas membranifera]
MGRANRTLEPAPVANKDLTGTMTVKRQGGEIKVYTKNKVKPIQSSRPKTAQSTYQRDFRDLSITTGKKPLVPYEPNSHRNVIQPPDFRPPSRNISQIQLGDPNHPMSAAATFATTNSRSFASIKGLPVGYNNPGVSSRMAQWMHKPRD